MKEANQEDIAEYFNVTHELLPYLPELLSNIWALGSSPELVVEMLRTLRLSSGSTQVLDLGCGKGAMALTLAKELGFHIHGVDFFEPFIVEATKRSKELGLSSLCRFEQSDMRHISAKTRHFGLVIYTAVGGVLGSLDKCVEWLRQFIHPSGLMIIDDGFRVTDSRIDFLGYEYCSPYNETIRQLTVHGDTILKEKVLSFEDVRAMNQRNTEFITKNAKDLARQHPELAGSLFQFVEREKRECEILENDVASAIWIMQKSQAGLIK
jgi:SAM-dependent methyltransferase